jgi:hypothetical protein
MIDPHMERRRELQDRLASASIGSEWNLVGGLALAVDAAPPEPQIETLELPALQPDAAKLAKADVIASLYAGVPFETGRRREEEYRLGKITHG